MSERLLEAFREEAEWLTAAPSFELIEQRGRARRRRRRQAVLGMAAACVLAVTGIVATSAGEPRSEGPSGPVVPSVTPYPGPTMRTLAQGTYELAPGFGQSPTIVRFTVPPGWNAWEGPNRFEGMGPHTTDNEEVLSRGIDWYASVLVFEVDRITQRNCTSVDVSGHTPAQLARALARNPDLEVTSGPENTIRFGHHTVHLRLRANRAEPPCGWTFRTPWGYTGGGDDDFGSKFDAWVVDVDGRALLLWAGWSQLAPRADVDALLGIVDSIEIVEGP